MRKVTGFHRSRDKTTRQLPPQARCLLVRPTLPQDHGRSGFLPIPGCHPHPQTAGLCPPLWTLPVCLRSQTLPEPLAAMTGVSHLSHSQGPNAPPRSYSPERSQNLGGTCPVGGGLPVLAILWRRRGWKVLLLPGV